MALADLTNNSYEPAGLTPEEAARYEGIILSRRARDVRRHRERLVTEDEYRAEFGGGHGAQGDPPTGSAWTVETPVPSEPMRRPRKRRPMSPVERGLSLQDMARRITGKAKR